jgi:predicted permease
MSLLDGLRHRLHVLLRGERYARDVERELRFHAELAALERTVGDRLDAEHTLGNATYYQEEVRRMTLTTWFDRILQDATYAVRGLKRSPGFTAAVVLTLGLGVGVNGAMFSLLDRIFLQPPPGVERPSEIRRVYLNFVNGTGSSERVTTNWMPYPQFRAFRDALGPAMPLGLFTRPDSSMLLYGNARIPVRTSRVNSDYFSILGVRAAAGRLFDRSEDDIGVPAPVAVISDAFWRRAFDGDRAVIGKEFTLGPRRFTIVGIAPPKFTGLDVTVADMWLPANTFQATSGFQGIPWYESFGSSFTAIARAVSPADEERLVNVGMAAIRPIQIRGWLYDPAIRVLLGPIVAAAGPGSRPTEVVVATRIAGVALLVLLIAGANIANLFLLRAALRKRDIAVRRALGVGRGRLVEQLTVESLLLATFGAGIALVFAWWATLAIRRLILPNVVWAAGPIDARTTLFVLAVAVTLGVVAGLMPAIHAFRPDLAESLKSGRRGTYRGSKLRASLLALQAALCVVLLVGSGLFIRSLDNVRSIDVGYDIENQIFMWPTFDDLPAHRREVGIAIPQVAQRLATVDGVEAVAYASVNPMQGSSFRSLFLPGRDSVPTRPEFGPSITAVSREYFRATGVRLREGRTFDERDHASAQRVVIVSESVAQLYWPGEPALGKCVIVGTREAPCALVVGVAKDAHRRGIIEPVTGQLYTAFSQWPDETLRSLIVRVNSGRTSAVIRAAEDIYRPLVTNMTGFRATTFATVLEPQLRPWRLGATLFSALATLALVVAAVGVYSVVAFGVNQRLHEMGVRLALGARGRDIVNLVFGDGVRVIGIGILIGVAVSLLLGRLVASLLFGIVPHDASVLIGASTVLCIVGITACVVPAVRAARVDPATTLRVE